MSVLEMHLDVFALWKASYLAADICVHASLEVDA